MDHTLLRYHRSGGPGPRSAVKFGPNTLSKKKTVLNRRYLDIIFCRAPTKHRTQKEEFVIVNQPPSPKLKYPAKMVDARLHEVNYQDGVIVHRE